MYLRGSPLRRSCTHLATEAKSPRLSQRRSLPARSGAGKGDAQQTDQGGGAAEIITGGVGLAAWRTNATTTISPFPTWSGSGNTKYLAASVRGNFAPNVPIASSVVLRLRDRVPLKGMGKLAALRRRRGGRGVGGGWRARGLTPPLRRQPNRDVPPCCCSALRHTSQRYEDPPCRAAHSDRSRTSHLPYPVYLRYLFIWARQMLAPHTSNLPAPPETPSFAAGRATSCGHVTS